MADRWASQTWALRSRELQLRLGELAPGRLARAGVPVGKDRAGVHGGVVQEVGGGNNLSEWLIPGGFFEGLTPPLNVTQVNYLLKTAG
jgi:hypothetical protein